MSIIDRLDKPFTMQVSISMNDIINEIASSFTEDIIIEFILALDGQMASWDFTKELYERLKVIVESGEEEGEI